jgi:hypothetical protein
MIMITGIKIITQLNSDEIVELNDLIREKNPKGMISKVVEKDAEPGSMGLMDFMPIIDLLLGSTVVAAGLKGLFDIIKSYFEVRSKQTLSKAEIEKTKIEQHNIEIVVETNDGKKTSLKFNSFNEDERKRFIETIDYFFKE